MEYFDETAKLFKAFCDPRRIEIIEMLSSGEKCACMLLEKLPIAQSTISHHMKILCDSGLVVARQEGKWTHYSLCDRKCIEAAQYISNLIGRQKEQCNSCK